MRHSCLRISRLLVRLLILSSFDICAIIPHFSGSDNERKWGFSTRMQVHEDLKKEPEVSQTASAASAASGPVRKRKNSPEGFEREFPASKGTRLLNMGGGEEQTYYRAGPRACPPPSSTARDYHYVSDHHFRSGSSSSRQSRNSSSNSSNYHSPHVAGNSSASSTSRRSGSGRSNSEYYNIEKSSPYHHGGGGGGRNARPQQVIEKSFRIH